MPQPSLTGVNSGGKMSVLVVDDVDDTRGMYALYMALLGVLYDRIRRES